MIKLHTLAQILSTRSRKALVCEACGGPFTCGARLSGCWCAEIKLSDETLTELKQRYRSCLCQQCLEGFAAREISFDG
jgi:hypothetical protein